MIIIKTHCSQEIYNTLITPFLETIPLEVSGLTAGAYNVDVNCIQVSFILEIDNNFYLLYYKINKTFYTILSEK